MPYPVHCPKCNAGLSVQDEQVGKNVRCPKCQTVFQAPPPAGKGGFMARFRLKSEPKQESPATKLDDAPPTTPAAGKSPTPPPPDADADVDADAEGTAPQHPPSAPSEDSTPAAPPPPPPPPPPPAPPHAPPPPTPPSMPVVAGFPEGPDTTIEPRASAAPPSPPPPPPPAEPAAPAVVAPTPTGAAAPMAAAPAAAPASAGAPEPPPAAPPPPSAESTSTAIAPHVADAPLAVTEQQEAPAAKGGFLSRLGAKVKERIDSGVEAATAADRKAHGGLAGLRTRLGEKLAKKAIEAGISESASGLLTNPDVDRELKVLLRGAFEPLYESPDLAVCTQAGARDAGFLGAVEDAARDLVRHYAIADRGPKGEVRYFQVNFRDGVCQKLAELLGELGGEGGRYVLALQALAPGGDPGPYLVPGMNELLRRFAGVRSDVPSTITGMAEVYEEVRSGLHEVFGIEVRPDAGHVGRLLAKLDYAGTRALAPLDDRGRAFLAQTRIPPAELRPFLADVTQRHLDKATEGVEAFASWLGGVKGAFLEVREYCEGQLHVPFQPSVHELVARGTRFLNTTKALPTREEIGVVGPMLRELGYHSRDAESAVASLHLELANRRLSEERELHALVRSSLRDGFRGADRFGEADLRLVDRVTARNAHAERVLAAGPVVLTNRAVYVPASDGLSGARIPLACLVSVERRDELEPAPGGHAVVRRSYALDGGEDAPRFSFLTRFVDRSELESGQGAGLDVANWGVAGGMAALATGAPILLGVTLFSAARYAFAADRLEDLREAAAHGASAAASIDDLFGTLVHDNVRTWLARLDEPDAGANALVRHLGRARDDRARAGELLGWMREDGAGGPGTSALDEAGAAKLLAACGLEAKSRSHLRFALGLFALRRGELPVCTPAEVGLPLVLLPEEKIHGVWRGEPLSFLVTSHRLLVQGPATWQSLLLVDILGASRFGQDLQVHYLGEDRLFRYRVGARAAEALAEYLRRVPSLANMNVDPLELESAVRTSIEPPPAAAPIGHPGFLERPALGAAAGAEAPDAAHADAAREPESVSGSIGKALKDAAEKAVDGAKEAARQAGVVARSAGESVASAVEGAKTFATELRHTVVSTEKLAAEVQLPIQLLGEIQKLRALYREKVITREQYYRMRNAIREQALAQCRNLGRRV